ncbi:MAG: 16S rRNA (uracil(1498)-N(3))-methyltransferase [Bacteroidales bacterium]|nr:16S rRNA (uracil(1498)-N(3))-methyltransferase [Bacteroidales bacterium]
MEIFYSDNIDGGFVRLDAEESAHCVRVLRHREGDAIVVVDGAGCKYDCTITSAVAGRDASVVARIDSSEPGWHGHPYRLTMAVCPTKNIDRYEWMVEKLTEIGVDRIVPVIGDRSERRVLKTDRLRRLIVSAGKQSLKAAFPVLDEPVSVRDFIASSSSTLKFIAYCSDEVQPRASLSSLIAEQLKAIADQSKVVADPVRQAPLDIIVLIGPEGDFSPEEVRAAMGAGFIPVHLGESRLRSETAAIVAATAVYLTGGQHTD